MKESNQSKIAQFHKSMLDKFSLAEVRTLCFALGVNYDSLGGEALDGKIRELIIHMAHNGRLPELQKVVEATRPHYDWPDISNAQLPSDWEESNQSKIAQFHKSMLELFSSEELRTLCLEIGVKYDTLGGEELSGKIRELIIRMAHNSRLPELQKAIEVKKPHHDWPDISNAQLPSDWEEMPVGPWNKKIIVGIVVFTVVPLLVCGCLLFLASRFIDQPVVINDPIDVILPTHTPTPLVSPTPDPVPVAEDHQILFLISDYAYEGTADFDVHNRIYETMREELGGGKFPNVIISRIDNSISREDIINDSTVIRTVADNYNARFFIWGFYDDAGFNPSFNLVRASAISIVVSPDGNTIPFDLNDSQLANELGLFGETESGIYNFMGEQSRLAEQPTEENFQKYIRDALPKQMTFLSALSLGYLLDPPQKTEALNIAIRNGHDLIAMEYLANVDYWQELLAKAYLWRGTSAIQDYQDSQQSIDDFSKSIELNPNNADAYYNRGLVFYQTNQSDSAINDLNQAIELRPDYGLAYSLRGLLFTEADEYELAQNDLNQSILLQPENANAYNIRGYSRASFGENDLAIADYSQAIDLEPNFTHAYFNRGLIYARKENHALAILDYSKAITLNPNHVDAYKLRGSEFSEIERYDLAIPDYSQAIKLQPNFLDAYIERGIAYLNIGEYAQAISDLNYAIELQPSSTLSLAEAYANRGKAQVYMDEYEGAISDLNQAIQLQPNEISYYYWRGLALYLSGNNDDAISDFENFIESSDDAFLVQAAIKRLEELGIQAEKNDSNLVDYRQTIPLESDSAEAYLNRGLIYSQNENHALAILDFSDAIRINPNLVEAYKNRGAEYEDIERYDLALLDYSQAIELQPDYADSHVNRGTVYLNIGEYAQAINDLNHAIELQPSSPLSLAKAFASRGIVRIRIFDYERALPDLNQAIQLRPDFAPYYNDLGIIYSNLNNHDQAISAFGQALALDPNYADAHNYRGIVYLNRGHENNNTADYEAAIIDFDQAIQLQPNEISFYYGRGTAHYLNDNESDAISDYTYFVESSDDAFHVQKAVERLEELGVQDINAPILSHVSSFDVLFSPAMIFNVMTETGPEIPLNNLMIGTPGYEVGEFNGRPSFAYGFNGFDGIPLINGEVILFEYIHGIEFSDNDLITITLIDGTTINDYLNPELATTLRSDIDPEPFEESLANIKSITILRESMEFTTLPQDPIAGSNASIIFTDGRELRVSSPVLQVSHPYATVYPAACALQTYSYIPTSENEQIDISIIDEIEFLPQESSQNNNLLLHVRIKTNNEEIQSHEMKQPSTLGSASCNGWRIKGSVALGEVIVPVNLVSRIVFDN